MSNGIYIVLGIAAIAAAVLIRVAISMHKVYKLRTALSELHEMPIDEWEAKWANYVQKEYNKVDDPRREEVESDMAFFRECREESKKGGQDGN